MEKRTEKRHKCQASIALSCFNNKKFFNAKMLNFSKKGMYFESEVLLKEGANIYFQMNDCMFDPSDSERYEGLRSVSLARVKWWKDIGGRKVNHYGFGVKYMEYY